ncbi:hypothetical protein POF51_29495 [Brevibacillus sp. AG]|uniref:hypothetical protein n=1 Tax=Brevibacillus sp. AG TaxID=3020891 RepID=UPI00232B62D5|nr:hypothetical protein [Brevibacillus sp. AG]MDC0764859.1 hypothetical protein [Brevibacillus sp. AG]
MKPNIVHVNSFGKKTGKFQEIIHCEETYYCFPVNRARKSIYYAKQTVDGRKEPIQLYSDFASSLRYDTTSVFAIEKNKIQEYIQNGLFFTGKMSIQSFYEVEVSEAQRFVEQYCNECEAIGEKNCASTMELFCAEEDRSKYRDSTWFSVQRELRLERKRKRSMTLPIVNGLGE